MTEEKKRTKQTTVRYYEEDLDKISELAGELNLQTADVVTEWRKAYERLHLENTNSQGENLKTLRNYSDKIINLFETGQDFEHLINSAAQSGGAYSAGRFGGFLIGWEDFKKFPVYGRGGVSELSYGAYGFGTAYIVNGIGNIMSQYGLFGLFVFFTFLLKSSLLIANYFRSKAKFAFFIVSIIAAMAFSTHMQIIIFTLMFISFYIGKKQLFINAVQGHYSSKLHFTKV